MTNTFVGATLDRAPGPRYVTSLRFAEIALRDPLPRLATLSKWRENFTSGFRLSIVAPKAAVRGASGPLRPDDASREATAWWTSAAEAIGADALVLPTPADLTTGQRDRDLLSRFIEPLRDLNRTIVWAPTGLWEWPHADAFAKHLGIVCAFDPLESPVPEGDILYARLTAMGKRTRFSASTLERIADAITSEEDVETAYVALESARSFQEAVQLQNLLAEDADHPSGEDSETDEDDEDDDGLDQEEE